MGKLLSNHFHNFTLSMNTNSAGTPLNLVLASPRGFCAGVERAVDIVNKAVDVLVRQYM